MARSNLPPGFRFHPTDEELLVHYLKKKVAGRRVYDDVIGEIEIYKFEPQDLPGLAALQSSDQEWFFFSAQDKKYLHGARTNRTTEAGYWKATGKDRKIIVGLCTGMKKTLIYYSGRAPRGNRTDWIMHEYRLDEELEKTIKSAKPFVLCRIRRKGGLGPRNGEQYGAPVLETMDEIEGGTSASYPPEEACVVPFAGSKFVEEQALDLPQIGMDEGVARTGGVGVGDDIDSFLQALLSHEEQEQKPIQEEVLSVDDLLDLVDEVSDFAFMEPPQAENASFMDLGFEDMDNLCNLLSAATDNESATLEDILQFASGQVECPDDFSGRRPLQEWPYQDALDAVNDGDFIELADLEEPYDEQGTIECPGIEEVLYELDNGVESTRLTEEWVEVQSLQSSGDRQSLRSLQHVEERGMVNEQLALEVPLDSCQGLNKLDSIYTSLLTSDEGGGFSDDLPSGFDINSGNAEDSHSHSSRDEEPFETQLVRVDNLPGGVNLDMEGGGHLVASEDTEQACGEDVSANRNTYEQPNSTAGLPNNNTQLNSSVGSLAPSSSSPSSSSPSSFARVISEVLGKINVLPASADGMPVELGRHKPLLMDSSKSSASGSKLLQSALSHRSPSSISSASLHFRVKLIDLEDSGRTPEMELHLSVSHAVSKQSSTQPWKSLANRLSLFLFRMTTLAVILFWMFRGFCRSTLSAF